MNTSTSSAFYHSSIGSVRVISRPAIELGSIDSDGQPLTVVPDTTRKHEKTVMLDKPAVPSDWIVVPVGGGDILLFPFSVFDQVATGERCFAPLSKAKLIPEVPPKATANSVTERFSW